MLSFKSYLKEESNTFRIYATNVFYLTFDKELSKKEKINEEDKIKQLLGSQNFDYERVELDQAASRTEYTLYIQIKILKSIDNNELKSLTSEMKDLLKSDYTITSQRDDTLIVIYQLGNFNGTLSADYIHLAAEENMSLKNIDKIIKDVKFLKLFGFENIISNLTSLFKIKPKPELIINVTTYKNNTGEIADIIRSNWKTGNMLKCTKELIENGFKDYV